MLHRGVLLADRYRLEQRLGSGGMGEVWRATDVVLGRPVAVKILLPDLVTDPDFGARFRAEARMMAALRHPGVVNVYDYGETEHPDGGGIVYLVLEYVDSEPLSRRIAAAGRLSVAETMSVVAQAAEALDAAHTNGIVHRDVKPGNLLIRPDGTVMLVDFGVARSPAITSVTAANAVVGTALYMAPEQASGRPVSPASDIYALGGVAYHCLVGHPPFTGANPLEVAVKHVDEEPPALPRDIPAPVRALVARALAKSPADRYPTAAAFAEAARAVAGKSVMPRPATGYAAVAGDPEDPAATTLTAPPVVPDARGRRGRSRGRAAVVAAAAAVLLAVAGVTALLSSDRGGESPAGDSPPTPSARAEPTAGTPSRQGSTGSPKSRPASGSAPTTARSSAAARPSAPPAPPLPTAVPTTLPAPAPSLTVPVPASTPQASVAPGIP